MRKQQAEKNVNRHNKKNYNDSYNNYEYHYNSSININ